MKTTAILSLSLQTKKMAYSAMEKLCNIYPDDYINVSEWGNGQISNYYESDLEGVLEGIIDD